MPKTEHSPDLSVICWRIMAMVLIGWVCFLSLFACSFNVLSLTRVSCTRLLSGMPRWVRLYQTVCTLAWMVGFLVAFIDSMVQERNQGLQSMTRQTLPFRFYQISFHLQKLESRYLCLVLDSLKSYLLN